MSRGAERRRGAALIGFANDPRLVGIAIVCVVGTAAARRL
jgi:hypothetical protein